MGLKRMFFVAVLVFFLTVPSWAERPPLKLREDGTFKIMLFTDLHFGYGGKTDKNSVKQMRDLMSYEEPDLVVLGGDQISDYAPGPPIPKPREWWKKYYGNALEAVAERHGKTPWVSILGNHDYGTQGHPDEILAYDSTFEGSLTLPSNDTGQILTILDSAGHNAVTRLYLFNCGQSGCYPRHAKWYLTASETARLSDPPASSPVPALAFVHIPLVQMLDVYNGGSFRGDMGDRDGICCQTTNHTLFEDFVANDEVKLVSSGHDHGNTLAGSWEGIHLTYGRKTGKGGYDIKGKYGSRVFLIKSTSQQIDSQSTRRRTKRDTLDQWKTTEEPLGAVLFEHNRSVNQVNNLGVTLKDVFSNSTITLHSWIRHIDGTVDEQLNVIEEIPIYQLERCCKGPPKEIPWALILGTTGTSLLVIVAVSLLIHGYCRYRKYSRELQQAEYVPMDHMD